MINIMNVKKTKNIKTNDTKIKFSTFKEVNAYTFDKLPDINNKDNYTFVLNKLKNSEKRYDKNNTKKIKQETDFFCSLVYFFPEENKGDITIEYNNDFIYSLNIKLKDLSFDTCEKLVKDICTISQDKQSYFIKDINMEEFIKKNKSKFNDKYTLYYLKIKTKETLLKLLKNQYKIYDDAIIKILEPYYKNINDNIKIINDDNLEIIITDILCILKFYEKINNQIWIKSQGEFYSLITLILILNSAIQINKKVINNPSSTYKLEIDFYISEYGLAIEIDGKHHKNNEQTIKNDILKNILLDNGEINLIRIEWNNTPTNFYENLYTKLNDYYFKKYKEQINISKINYLKILEHIKKNIKFPSFSYNYEIKKPPPKDFKTNVSKDIIEYYDKKMYYKHNLNKNIKDYDKIINDNNIKINNTITK